MVSSTSDWPEKLLAWYDREKRDLPWRENRTPYTTWVSEVMLQQTKVETVRPYYLNWLEKFPNPAAVANASESEVLHAWQGLGYYSRARNLQRAMREVTKVYDGEIPADATQLERLPGVGPYMKGAILSQAFGQAEPAVDGNVLRVFARLYGIEQDVLSQAVRRQVTELVRKMIPQDRPGDFNEALMDLGAMVCVPKQPRCIQCPLRQDCLAWATNKTQSLPYRKPKNKPLTRYVTIGICESKGRYLLQLRPTEGMLASMWEFPAVETETLTEGRKRWQENWQGRLLSKCQWRHRHVFTHRIWEMRAYQVKENTALSQKGKWFLPEEFLTIPLAGPHARLAAYILRGE